MKSAILSFISMFFLPIILLRGISAPVEDTPKNDALITEGEVTVTSLENLKRYADAGLVDEYLYDELYRFLVDGWEYPEVNDEVEISDYSITFDLPFDGFEGFDFYFTVSKSGLSTLPVGKYHKQLITGVYYFYLNDVDVVTEEKYNDVPEVKKLRQFIGSSYTWNIPTYGEGTTYPGVFDYIYTAYGENVGTGLKLDYDEFSRIAKELFGVERPELLVPVGNIQSDGALWPFHSFLVYQYDVADVTKDEDGTKIILQFYADFYKFILSHKVEYSFGADGKWLGCRVLEEGKYPPHSLRYAEDDGIIRVQWPYNLIYLVDHGVFDKEQCDFYLDFLREHRDKYYIGNYTISFDPNQNDEYPFESYVDFEVARSNDDTLPVGEYHRKLVSGDVLSFEDVDAVTEEKYNDVPEVKKLRQFIDQSRIWNTPTYGEGTIYPGVLNYIYAAYGEGDNLEQGGGLRLDYDEFCCIAKEEFGVDRPELLVPIGTIADVGVFAGMLRPRYLSLEYRFDVADVTKDEDGTKVILQFYADLNKLVLSHKVEYSFGADGKWLGCRVLEEGKYHPLGLEYAEDNELIAEGEITVTSLEELKKYTVVGMFTPREYNYYYDLISDDGKKEAFHSVIIPEFEITFEPEKSGVFESRIRFTVTESDLYTLPVGEYEKVLTEYSFLLFEDVNKDVDSEKTEAVFSTESAGKVYDYLTRTLGNWRTPVYGECETDDVLLTAFCYICEHYDKVTDRFGALACVPYDTLEEIAEKEFGITDCSRVKEWGDAWAFYNEETDMVYSYGGIGPRPFEIIDEKDDGEIETVIIQLFGDYNKLIPSYKVEYRFSKDGKWLGYEIIDEGRSKPTNELSWEQVDALNTLRA